MRTLPSGTEVGAIEERVALSDAGVPRYAYVGQGRAFLQHPFIRGAWVLTDQCVLYAACPDCNAPAGTLCSSRRGKLTTSTHWKRRAAWDAEKRGVRYEPQVDGERGPF